MHNRAAKKMHRLKYQKYPKIPTAEIEFKIIKDFKNSPGRPGSLLRK